MKDESCKTCKHRDWYKCKKMGETINPYDWCSWYKFKGADSVIDKFFQERAIAKEDQIFRRMEI